MPLVQVATDGWSRQACAGGTSLLNCMVLHPDGGSSFLDVIDAEGETKDAQWVANTHILLLQRATGGNKERENSIIMDNTSTNIAAMALLKHEHPHIITLGCQVRSRPTRLFSLNLNCQHTLLTHMHMHPHTNHTHARRTQAHALDLIIKDLAGATAAGLLLWSKWVYDTAKLMSSVINGNRTVREALHAAQREEYKSTLAVSANNPTRFAGLHLISKELVASKIAIVSICPDADVAVDKRRDTFSTCANSAAFIAAALGTGHGGRGHGINFWQGTARMVELVQPVSDAIHQLEADRPLLSRVLSTWVQLLNHAKNFDEKHGLDGNQRTARLFNRRFALHYKKEWLAAHALDPANAVRGEDGTWSMPLTREQLPWPTGATGEPLKIHNSEEPVMRETDILTCITELCGGDAAAAEEEFSTLELEGIADSTLVRLMAKASKKETVGGKTSLAPVSTRRGWWRVAAGKGFPLVATAAKKLLSCHVTACATERNWSLWGNIYVKARNRLALERAKKLIGIRHNGKVAAPQPLADEDIVLELLSKS